MTDKRRKSAKVPRPTVEEERIAALLAKEQQILCTLDGQSTWLRPMDLGGRDASWHSPTLVRLIKKGLVERRLRGTLMNVYIGSRRGSYEYRLTIAGRRAAKEATVRSRRGAS